MRRFVFGLGALQVLVTGIIIALLMHFVTERVYRLIRIEEIGINTYLNEAAVTFHEYWGVG